MNNIVDKKNKKKEVLLDFQISSQNKYGASTEYCITEDGAMSLDVACGYMLPSGPTKLRVEDQLSDEELLYVKRFIHSEMAEEEYLSVPGQGIEYLLRSPERVFVDCVDLVEKFMNVLNYLALGHPVFSRESILPICRAMEEQAIERTEEYQYATTQSDIGSSQSHK